MAVVSKEVSQFIDVCRSHLLMLSQYSICEVQDLSTNVEKIVQQIMNFNIGGADIRQVLQLCTFLKKRIKDRLQYCEVA